MKISIWVLLLAIYLTFVTTLIMSEVGRPHAGYTFEWYEPFEALAYFGLPAYFAYMAGRDERNKYTEGTK